MAFVDSGLVNCCLINFSGGGRAEFVWVPVLFADGATVAHAGRGTIQAAPDQQTLTFVLFQLQRNLLIPVLGACQHTHTPASSQEG